MTDPILALSVAAIISVVAALLFWPERGIIWQLRRNKQHTERVLIEDALKQLYDHEYRNKPATIKSISGAMEQSLDKTAMLMEKLSMLNLVEFDDTHFHLTAVGRTYALKIIRMHRLWERYFADETGLSEMEWHREAERREHTTTADQAEQLSRFMGHPSFDPHGDPIPTEKGELPPSQGKPLSEIPEGEFVRITHLEDEPAALYAQLVAEGLNPGMQIQVLEKHPQRIRISSEGEDIVLAPIVAANITVASIPKGEEKEVPTESLLDLKTGETGEVIMLSHGCRGLQRRRLMDLGIIPGTLVRNELPSASRNPIAYNIRGALIALRSDQARLIRIKKVS